MKNQRLDKIAYRQIAKDTSKELFSPFYGTLPSNGEISNHFYLKLLANMSGVGENNTPQKEFAPSPKVITVITILLMLFILLGILYYYRIIP